VRIEQHESCPDSGLLAKSTVGAGIAGLAGLEELESLAG
jgi:hypothetical protein